MLSARTVISKYETNKTLFFITCAPRVVCVALFSIVDGMSAWVGVEVEGGGELWYLNCIDFIWQVLVQSFFT